MEKQELEMLEEYITTGNKGTGKPEQLQELCDIVDEIRALYPPMPASDFIEQTTERIAGELSARQTRKKLASWLFKSAGWTSAAVAAVVLVTIGVLPHKPSEQLPSVPMSALQQVAQQPAMEISPPLIATGEVIEKSESVTNSDLSPQNKPQEQPKKQEAAAANPPMPTLTSPKDVSPERSITEQAKDRKEKAMGTTKSGVYAGQKRFQAEQFLVDDPLVVSPSLPKPPIEMPFKVVTAPDKSPIQVEINDNPPEVTMTYQIDKHEIVVRQWPQVADDATKSGPVPDDQAVRLLRGDIMVEVSGDADRVLLEKFAHSLE